MADALSPEQPLYEPENLASHDEVMAGLMKPSAGAAALAPTAPTGKVVHVVDAEGRSFGVDEAFLPTVLQRGFKLETPEQRMVREYAKAHSKWWDGGLNVAADNFIDMATFGAISPEVTSKLAGVEDPLESAKREALAKRHKIAGAIGSIAGLGTGLVLGEATGLFEGAGAVGGAVEKGVLDIGGDAVGEELARLAPKGAEAAAEAAGPSFARKLVASGLGHAVEGSVLSAPKALTEASLGDPEEAAETLLYGAGAGALFGLAGPSVKQIGKGLKAGGEYAGSLVSKAIPGVEEAGGVGAWAGKRLRAISDKQVIKSFNPLRKFSRKIYGIGEEDVANVARDFDLMPKPGDTAESVFEKVDSARRGEGKAIGSFVEDASGTAPRLESSGVTSAVDDTLADLGEKYDKTSLRAAKKRLDKFASDFIEDYPEGASVDDLHKFQAGLGRKIPNVLKTDIDKEAIGAFRRRVNDAMLTQMEGAIEASGGDVAEQLSAFAKHRANYRALNALAEATEENIPRGLSIRGHSATDYAANIIGGVVGSAAGHPIAGAVAGGLANKFGRLYGNRYVASGAEALANMFDSAHARNPLDAGGLLGIEQAQKYVKGLLDEIGPALSGEKAARIAEGGTIHAATDFINSFLTGKSSNADKIENFKSLAEDLAQLAADPQHMQAKVEKAIAPFTKDAPTVSVHYGQRLAATAQYLHETMPKNPNPPNPFVDREWKPSDAEMALWARRWQTTLDPFSTVQRVLDGTLNSADMETLTRLYPKLHQRIVTAVAEYATDGEGKKTMSYSRRTKLALLTGSPSVESSLASIGKLQKLFAASAPQPANVGGQAPKNPHAKIKPIDIMPPTGVQKIAAK